MKKNKLNIFLIFLILFLLQGCIYVDYCFTKNFKLMRNEKKEFIEKVIVNRIKFDSIIRNSIYYHKDYSRVLFLKNNSDEIIKCLNQFKDFDSRKFRFFDNLDSAPETKSWVHEIIIMDKQDTNNILSFSFTLVNSNWYIKGLRRGSWRVEINGIDDSWNEF